MTNTIDKKNLFQLIYHKFRSILIFLLIPKFLKVYKETIFVVCMCNLIIKASLIKKIITFSFILSGEILSIEEPMVFLLNPDDRKKVIF